MKKKISFFAPQKEREREIFRISPPGGKKRKKNFPSKTGFSKKKREGPARPQEKKRPPEEKREESRRTSSLFVSQTTVLFVTKTRSAKKRNPSHNKSIDQFSFLSLLLTLFSGLVVVLLSVRVGMTIGV